MIRSRLPALALALTALGCTGAAEPADPSPGSGPTATPSPSASRAPSPSPTASPTQSDGTLQILAYRGYAEYGGISPQANWTGTFEKDTGCRLARIDTVQTPEEMSARLRTRAYDLVSAGPVVAAELIEAGKVQPVDADRVEGYDDIPERLRDLVADGDTVYGVPFLWGYHEFLYDTSRVKGGDLADVFGSGRVMLRDSPLTLADAALAGGVSHPFELDAKSLDEVAERLEGTSGRTFWTNQLDLIKGFATGSVDYGQATPHLRELLVKARQPVKAVSARKVTGWADSWMLGAGVTATDCAYRWLNRMTETGTQRDAAAWNGLAPANTKACKGRARSVCEAYGATRTNRLDRVVFATRPPGDCRPPKGECTDYAAWSQRWRELVE
ncbi:extracellular solute-binding protein [Nonomuraea sp. NPDC048826]|uniref:extracellular solute-binding protein n=1 Tax=Nonomuraea sp. NPDC048826 TaxID=3364347 RepID=UPI0037201AEA